MKKKIFIGAVAALLLVPTAVFAKGNPDNPEAKITTCGDVTNCKLTITKQGAIYAYGHKIRIEKAPGGFCEADPTKVTKATCEAASKTWYNYSLIYIDDSTKPVDLAKETYTDTDRKESWNAGEFSYSQVYDATLTGEMATNTTNGFNLYDSSIIGGSKNEDLTANTNVIMNGGTVYSIFAGNSAYSYGTTALSANLTGSTNLTYNGGIVIKQISGGSQVTASGFTGTTVASANVSGEINVTYDIKEATTNNIPLYVGSYVVSGAGTSKISGTKTLNLTSSATITSSNIVDTADVVNVKNKAEVTIGATMPVTTTLNVEAGGAVVLSSGSTVPEKLTINSVPLASVKNNTSNEVTVKVNGTAITLTSEATILTIANAEDTKDATVLLTGVIYPNRSGKYAITKTDLTTGEVYTKMTALLGTSEKSIGVFDLSLGENNDYTGKLTVSIKLGSTYANKALTVRHWAKDATKAETFNVTADDNGTVLVQLDSLSPIMVSQTVVENPKTLDNILNYAILGGLSMMGIVCAAIVLKKRAN